MVLSERQTRRLREPSGSRMIWKKAAGRKYTKVLEKFTGVKPSPEEEVPIKVLSLYDMPLSAKMFMDLFESEHLDKRNKWDQVSWTTKPWRLIQIRESLDFMRYPSSFPLWDRSFLLYYPHTTCTKEIDWFGKRAFIQIQKNAWHPSKLEGADGLVRVTNGGNFYCDHPRRNKPRRGVYAVQSFH
ncbi:hypothetical protein OS493_015043 [Desmophyllum pertusum]|uniref:Uncharacterized protein n=1 Tax=Desmophyllum pertusum TaxID=174260 RepID=A0A9W9ZPE9_9CNID|nr:hypothetical protein OS493_015043 [Desmophyllum pertusum]